MLIVGYGYETGHWDPLLRMRYRLVETSADAERGVSNFQRDVASLDSQEVEESTNVPLEVARFWNDARSLRIAGRPLPELFVFDGACFWPHLTEHFSYSIVDESIRFIEHLDRLLNETTPETLWVQDEHVGLARQFAERRGVEVHGYVSRAPRDLESHTARRLLGTLRDPPRAWRAVARRTEPALTEALFGRDLKRLPKGALLLCSSVRNYRFLPSGELFDEYFAPIVDAVRQRREFPVIGVDLRFGDLALPYLRIRRSRLPYPIVPFSLFESRHQSDRVKAAREWFRQRSAEIIASPEFRFGFSYRGVSLADHLRPQLAAAVAEIPAAAAGYVEAAERMIRDLEPSAVLLVYEVGQKARSIIIAANRSGVPTFGLAHGVNVTAAPYYLMGGQRELVGGQVDVPVFLPPDRTFVFGELDRRSMTKLADYPEESVVVTGDWRLDAMHQLVGQGGPGLARARLGLPESGRVLSVFTSGWSGRAFAALVKNLDLFDVREWSLVIKMHPVTDPKAVRAKVPHGWKGKTHVLTDRLAEATVAADLVVVLSYSSVIANALSAGKSLIVADFTKSYLKSLVDFREIVEVPTSADQLRDVLRRYLAGESVNTKDRYPAMIRELVHAFDGHSAARAADELLRTVGSAPN